MLVCVSIFEASHGLHSHRVVHVYIAKCHDKQTVLLKISRQILSSQKAQKVKLFVACMYCIRRYIYQTCRRKVQIGNDQEMTQSERNYHSINRGVGKTKMTLKYLYHENMS